MPRASAGLLPRRTLRTAGGIVFLNIQGFKERILLPTTSGGLSGGHTSTRLAQGPRGGGSRAVCCAHTGDSRVPKNLPKIPNYELGTVAGGGAHLDQAGAPAAFRATPVCRTPGQRGAGLFLARTLPRVSPLPPTPWKTAHGGLSSERDPPPPRPAGGRALRGARASERPVACGGPGPGHHPRRVALGRPRDVSVPGSSPLETGLRVKT